MIISLVAARLKRRNISVSFTQDLDQNQFDPTITEMRVANSTVLVVLLTKNCLKQNEVVFAMTAADRYYNQVVSRVVLVCVSELVGIPNLTFLLLIFIIRFMMQNRVSFRDMMNNLHPFKNCSLKRPLPFSNVSPAVSTNIS